MTRLDWLFLNLVTKTFGGRYKGSIDHPEATPRLATSCVDGCVSDHSDISCLFENKLKSSNLLRHRSLLMILYPRSNISPEVVSMVATQTHQAWQIGWDWSFLWPLSVCFLFSVWLNPCKVFHHYMLRHGHMPESLRDCVLQPVLKQGKDPCNSDSYRPIALAPTLSKVFEWCLLLLDRDAYSTSRFNLVLKRASPVICARAC